MSLGRVFGVMLDNEATNARTEFDIAKFDSDPWAKKNMAWDSDKGLDGTTTISAVLDSARDNKLLTVQVRNTPEMNAFYKILQKALNKENHAKEGVFDRFQLNVTFGGDRHSVTFKNPIVNLAKAAKEKVDGKSVNFVILSVKTKTEPVRNGGPL